MKRCIITGASGFLGSAFVSAFLAAGWEVIELGRKPFNNAAAWLPFDLRQRQITALPAADVFIHSAYDFRSIRWPEIKKFNVERTTELFEAYVATGKSRFIFISSMAAYPGCKSLYGRSKLMTEQAIQPRGAVIVRPGFVVGPGMQGLAGTLEKMAATLPIVPMIGSGCQPLYTCHIDDLCRAIVVLSNSDHSPARPVVTASESSTSLSDMIRTFGRRHSRNIRLINIPATVIRQSLRLCEFLRVPTPLRSDSVTSLVYQNPSPFQGCDRVTEVRFRSFQES